MAHPAVVHLVDVAAGSGTQLLNAVAGRDATGPSRWPEAQPETWRRQIRSRLLDLSASSRKTFADVLEHVTQTPIHSTSSFTPTRSRTSVAAECSRSQELRPTFRARLPRRMSRDTASPSR